MVMLLLACWVTDKEVGSLEQVTAIQASMVEIPSGTFGMGCTEGQSGCGSNETEHTVTLTHSFNILSSEVTQAQFKSVMGYQPSNFAGCADCPVETVSWHEAVAFTNALSTIDSLQECYVCTGSGQQTECEESVDPYLCAGYRLPTEAEWEYAARGGEDTLYAGSDNIDDVAWFGDNSGDETHAICQKQQNGYGLCDMSGNVWEWVSDRYGDYSSSGGTFNGDHLEDPQGNASSGDRVYRGGSWTTPPDSARVAFRYYSAPSGHAVYLGFRISRTIP